MLRYCAAYTFTPLLFSLSLPPLGFFFCFFFFSQSFKSNKINELSNTYTCEKGATARAAWERRLWLIGSPWASSPGQVKEPADGVNMIEDWTVVYCTFGEFVIFLAGDDEYDELILANEVTYTTPTRKVFSTPSSFCICFSLLHSTISRQA
jgi:hypothetical protein